VNDRKTFVDKLNTFIFGPPIPVLSNHDLDMLHQIDQKLDTLLNLLQTQHGPPSDQPSSSNEEPERETIAELTEQVRKLAKTQFKTNTLQETQLAQQQEVLTSLQHSVEQQEKRIGELNQHQQQVVEQAQLETIKSLLPIIDSLDAAFNTGRRQVLKLPMPTETRQAIVAWLDGIRLARLRLLDILKSHDVAPIVTVGQSFNPNRHVAVAADTSGRAADGIIVGEDRRGYATPGMVLRYAEVIVARSRES
jgi:molecular chaperone GrpE